MDLTATRALVDFLGRQGGKLLSLLEQEGRLRAIEGPHPIEEAENSWGLPISGHDGPPDSPKRLLEFEQIVAVKAHIAGHPPAYFGDSRSMVEAEVLMGLRATREEYSSGQYAAAAAVARACLGLISRELGPFHIAATVVMAELANALRRLGRLPEAGEYAESACVLARRLLAPGDPRLTEILHVRALTCADMGELIEGRLVAQEVIDVRAQGRSATAIADILATLSRIDCDLAPLC